MKMPAAASRRIDYPGMSINHPGILEEEKSLLDHHDVAIRISAHPHDPGNH